MRILSIGSVVALTLAACGGGDKDATCDPATDPSCGTVPTTGTTTGNGDSGGGGGPECLDLSSSQTVFIDLSFGWSETTGTTVPVTNLVGTVLPSAMTLTLGDASFQGDTSIPGPPDNWCFIEYNIDGVANANTDPSWWFALGNVDPSNAISNCGMESSPGAGDMVTLCDPDSLGGDPASFWSSANWAFKFGGEPSSDYDADIQSFAGYGYTADDFMSSEWSFDLDGGTGANPPEAWEAIVWALETDANNAMVPDAAGTGPVRIPRVSMQGPGGLVSGFYTSWNHTYWTFTIGR